jgi:hypothetical protein
MGITDTQSYSWVMRGVFFDALSAMPFFSSFTCRKQKQLPVQTPQLPYLGVYFVREPHTPDGDLNAGEIGFIHSPRIGISVVIANNDPDASEAKLDQAYWAIMNRLWTDEYIMNMIDTYNPHNQTQNPDNTRAEGIERIERRHVFGNAGLNNEYPSAELQLEITFRLRTRWPAFVPDNLEHIHVEARPVVGNYPPHTDGGDFNDGVQPVIAEWDMETIEESPDYSEPPPRGTSTDPPPSP